MKLYAQHGFQDGEKINEGFRDGSLSGVVFGPKDISPDRLPERLTELRAAFPAATTLFDPQYYASLLGSNPNIRLGNLEDYPYFRLSRRSQLESSDRVGEALRACLDYQAGLPVNGIIAPNILISRSFDSVEAVIAKNFVRQAGPVFQAVGDARPVFATLAISQQALLDPSELQSFLNDITLLDSPPHGFYLLVATSSSEARNELFNADVIAAWLLLNYTLKLGGFAVINGYSDRLSPFLGAVGGDVGCTGWFNTLRTFSLERFAPSGTGGRLPIQRYFSKRLLNRVTHIELDALRSLFPELVNGLPHDADYADGEPMRNREVLQSWEAIASLLGELTAGDIEGNLARCDSALAQTTSLYARLAATGYRVDARSGDEHLEPLREGIQLFKELAEL